MGSFSSEGGALIFWDSEGVMMIDYLVQGRTINGAYNVDEVRRLRQVFALNLLLQDNAPENTLQIAMTAAADSFLIPESLLIWLLLSSIYTELQSYLRGKVQNVEAISDPVYWSEKQ